MSVINCMVRPLSDVGPWPDLSNRARLGYPLGMSANVSRRPGAKSRVACVLAVAIVVLTTGLPVAPFCCVPKSPCCAVGLLGRAPQQTEMSSTTPDCCRPIVRNGTPVPSERMVPRPEALDSATLPIMAPIAANLPSRICPAALAADPQPGKSWKIGRAHV